MILNLPTYTFRTKSENGKKLIFDQCRKKWVALTPEEWVRQNIVQHLIKEKQFPQSLIAVEMSLRVNQQNFRSDIVLFGTDGTPKLVVECKAPQVTISQQTFDQIARYNMQLKTKYLMVTNGLNHYCCKLNPETGSFQYLKEIPDYREL
jgi:hypothetical protein